jgi:hypothetical protein
MIVADESRLASFTEKDSSSRVVGVFEPTPVREAEKIGAPEGAAERLQVRRREVYLAAATNEHVPLSGETAAQGISRSAAE